MRRAQDDRSVAGTYRVDRVMFSGDSGFRIIKAEHVDTREQVSIKGTLHDVVRGSIVQVVGRWVSHARWGEQIEVDTCTTSPPEDKDGAAVYLAGCPKVSEVLARRIVTELGADIWRAVEQATESLQNVRGVGVKLAQDISEWYRVNRDERETVTALASWGLGRRQVKEAVRTLRPLAQSRGQRVEELVRENPWILAEEVDGVGLQTADEIAARLRLDPNCVDRARAGILVETLRADNREGHCWSDRADVISRTARGLPIERHVVAEGLAALVACGKVVLEGERVWRTPMLAAERAIAEGIAARLLGAQADAEEVLDDWAAEERGLAVDAEEVRAAIEENLDATEDLHAGVVPF